jgi:hypothetical protein
MKFTPLCALCLHHVWTMFTPLCVIYTPLCALWNITPNCTIKWKMTISTVYQNINVSTKILTHGNKGIIIPHVIIKKF